MKIANLEGTTEEIKNFFLDTGLNPSDYFVPIVETPTKKIWLILPCLSAVVSLVLLCLMPKLSAELRLLALISTFCSAIWGAVVLQIMHKNPWATGIFGIGVVVVALVAIGVLTPSQLLDEIKALKTK